MSHSFTKKKSSPVGRWIVLVVVVIIIGLIISFTRPISLTQSIVVTKGDTLNVFLTPLTSREKFKIKTYIKTHDFSSQDIKLWTYQFSGTYTPETFLQVIESGPVSQYVRFTVLEWRSIYDIDATLAEKWFTQPGAYIAYVSSGDTIQKAAQGYRYIAEASAAHSFTTLEWWLYPDTYFVDPTKDILSQLVRLQLQAFDAKVYTPYTSAITAFPSLLEAKGLHISYSMDLWNILRLASIIEKEERNTQNKPTVAWIFFNRLEQWTSLGADITLCYGLHQPYEKCPPSVINANIEDTDNIYNTRTHRWLPPTPIANSSIDTIRAVLEFTRTPYFFYLHDANGIIRYAENIQWHNDNISKYLK